MNTIGKHIWFDLATSDTAAAILFYSEAVGWKTMAFEGGDKPYTMFTVGDLPIAGVMDLPDELVAMKIPPHWMGYVQVEDVDKTVAKAKELGATIHKAGWDIPKVGRIAVLADLQGAAFCVFTPLGNRGAAHDRGAIGTMSWSELNTTDYESAWSFYSALLGWKETMAADMGPAGIYFMFTWPEGKDSMGGMSNAAAKMAAPPHWLHYINVDDMEAAIGRITKAGGKVLNGPMDVPGGSVVAQCMDPQGASFAIHAQKK